MLRKYFVYWLNILCQQRCKEEINKCAVITTGFSIRDKHFIEWLWVCLKSVKQSISARCILMEHKYVSGINIFNKIRVKSLICRYSLLCRQCAVDHQQRSVNAATAVIFSNQCFSPPKIHPLSGNTLVEILLHTFHSFCYNHLIKCLSSTVYLIVATTLLLASCLHYCQQRTFNKQTNYFRHTESPF